jgi:hypothetical protein
MEKEFQKGKGFAGRFPPRRPASTAPLPISTRESGLPLVTMPLPLTAGTHQSGLSPPNPPLLLPAWQRQPNCHYQVGHPSPPPRCEDARMCACHLESSHRMWCTVVSHCRCPPAPVAARCCASRDAMPGAQR